MVKWHEDWKKILKTYSFLSIVANLLVAISISGLSILGVLSAQMAAGTLFVTTITLGVVGLVGRFINQSYDDLEKEKDE